MFLLFGRETSTQCGLQSMKLYVTPVFGGDLQLLIPADEWQPSKILFSIGAPFGQQGNILKMEYISSHGGYSSQFQHFLRGFGSSLIFLSFLTSYSICCLLQANDMTGGVPSNHQDVFLLPCACSYWTLSQKNHPFITYHIIQIIIGNHDNINIIVVWIMMILTNPNTS